MALTFHWGNTSRFVHWYFKCISFIAEKIEHLYRRVWDGSETRRSHTQKSAHRLHAAREDRTDSEAPGTSQPTAPTVPCPVVCLWNFTKHLPSSLWKKFVCYNGGDFRICSRYDENWGRNEVTVRMWLYLEVGVSVWLAAEPLNRILANRNINLTDAIKIFVTFKCLLKICTYVH